MHKHLSRSGRIAFIAILASVLFAPRFGLAQQKPDFAGDYGGLSGPLHVKLHLIAGRDGSLSGTIDSPDQNMVGIPCTDIHTNGQTLSFSVPMVSGSWTGFLSKDGTSLSGMWSQGTPVALNLTRITAAAPEAAAQSNATPQAAAQATVSTPSGDFVQDGFKFHRVGGFVQVVDIAKSQSAGTIIFPPNQPPMYAAMPGYDGNAIKAAYEKHGQPSTTTARAAGTGSAVATGNQQDLQGYEGSLGSLGDAKILLPGDSISTPEGTLKNEGDSTRVLVYFPRTQEKVSFSAGKSSNHKDDVVVWAGDFGSARTSAYAAKTLGGEAAPQYTEYLIHFTGGNNNMKHMVLGGLKANTVDRAKPGASALGTNSQAHTASFTISTVDANGHVQEALSSRQVDDWENTTSFSRGLHVDQRSARAAGLVAVADQALVDQGRENPDLQHVKKDYGIGAAEEDDLRYYAFGAGGMDKPGAQEKRDQRIGATSGALGTTTPPPQ